LIKVFYSDIFTIPLPVKHRFPIGKYQLLRDRLYTAEFAPALDFTVAEAASEAQILLVHQQGYLDKVKYGTLDVKELRRLGLPWSEDLFERARRSVGGTVGACREALLSGISINLAGGTHHAFPDHGEGFCVFNDAAIAARLMLAEEGFQQIIILDADVHQGNGTAAIFQDEPRVFTFSIHGEKNFPFRKVAGDLDIGLPDRSGDAAYMSAFEAGVEQVLGALQPELVIYLAGADPYEGDRLGRLAMSKAGLAARDKFVFDRCRAQDLPVAVAMAGGYAEPISDSVDIQLNTIAAAVESYLADGAP
jgi:acetoin utilization deacetylase AcuC-like enzyme